jgi:hypothetical protein
VILDLSGNKLFGGEPENETEHYWTLVYKECNANGYYILTACNKCGMLARRTQYTSWEHCEPTKEWTSEYLPCPTYFEELN